MDLFPNQGRVPHISLVFRRDVGCHGSFPLTLDSSDALGVNFSGFPLLAKYERDVGGPPVIRHRTRGRPLRDEVSKRVLTQTFPWLGSRYTGGLAWPLLADLIAAVGIGDLLQMHQPTLDSVDCRLRAVADAHFVQYAAHVDAHGFLGDMQLLRDVTIALPAGNAGKYFMLARS